MFPTLVFKRKKQYVLATHASLFLSQGDEGPPGPQGPAGELVREVNT